MRNSTRLSHLAHIVQIVYQNVHVREGILPANMQVEDFYVCIKFFCIHEFDSVFSMLMYSEYCRTRIVTGLMKDFGHWVDGFQDIFILKDLCTKCTRWDGMVYFIDDREKMEEHLQMELR